MLLRVLKIELNEFLQQNCLPFQDYNQIATTFSGYKLLLILLFGQGLVSRPFFLVMPDSILMIKGMLGRDITITEIPIGKAVAIWHIAAKLFDWLRHLS